jgi:pimeloyl-ACP methyl ester carboxylesterase
MWLGLEHPERLERLVLVAPIGADGYAADPAQVARARALRAAGDREQLLRERRAAFARSERFDEAAARAAIERSLSASERHFEGFREAMSELRLGSRLPQLAVPTLVIAGAADGLLGANVQDALRMGNATLHVFSRAAHSPQQEDPEGFNAVLDDFLRHGVVNAATLAARAQEAQAAPAGR